MGNIVELKNIDDFIITGKFGEEYYGGSDKWYREKGHREIANGATALATILSYYARSWPYFETLSDYNLKRKETFIVYMYDVLKYVSPGLIGIMAGDLRKGAEKYAEAKGFVFTSSELAIPGPKSNRPEYRAILQYIFDGLSRDVPVGFFSMGSGHVKNIKSNHWSVIVRMDSDSGTLDIIDNGELHTVDLVKWLKKSTMGGFFAIVEPEFED